MEPDIIQWRFVVGDIEARLEGRFRGHWIATVMADGQFWLHCDPDGAIIVETGLADDTFSAIAQVEQTLKNTHDMPHYEWPWHDDE